jgi:hypothetical protein
MRPPRATWIRFRNLFRTRQLNRDLDAELAAHLELHIADNLRAGMSPAEARRQALLKLGGLEQTKDRYRHADGFPFLESLLQDLRFAVRTLRKNLGFTALAILILALGIGANAAIFCVVDAVLLRSLPFPRSSELVDISGRSTSFDIPFLYLSMPDVADLRNHASSFASLAMYQDSPKSSQAAASPIASKAVRFLKTSFRRSRFDRCSAELFAWSICNPASTPLSLIIRCGVEDSEVMRASLEGALHSTTCLTPSSV